VRRSVLALAWAVSIAGCGGTAPATSPTTGNTVNESAKSTTIASPAALPPVGSWSAVPAPRNAPPGGTWIAIVTYDGREIVTNVMSPPNATSSAIVINLHGDGGLRVRNLDFAARFASDGFVAMTPCWSADFVDEGQAAAESFTPLLGCAATAPRRSSAANVTKDIDAIAAAARTLPGARADKVIVIGHSAGGTAAVLAGSMGARITSVISISGAYGAGTGPQSFKARWGTNPPEQADALAVPLLIVHSTSDERSLIEQTRAYVTLLQQKGKAVETLYVDGAPHDLPVTSYWTKDIQAKVTVFARK